MSTVSPTPPRLAPFLSQWDYIVDVLRERLVGLTDEEYLWEPAPECWTVRPGADGRGVPDVEAWAPSGEGGTPPRTLAWSIGHLATGVFQRADYLVGSHTVTRGDLTWPLSAGEGVEGMFSGLSAWRDGLDQMTDADLDTVGRSANPDGLDPTLPLIEIVWWVNKELIFHAAEIWYARDLFAARRS